MTEVSVKKGANSPEFSPKKETITHFEYDDAGLLVMETKTSYDLVEKTDKVISVRPSPLDGVDALIKVGYQPKEYFSKLVIMVLTESANKVYMDSLKNELEEVKTQTDRVIF